MKFAVAEVSAGLDGQEGAGRRGGLGSPAPGRPPGSLRGWALPVRVADALGRG